MRKTKQNKIKVHASKTEFTNRCFDLTSHSVPTSSNQDFYDVVCLISGVDDEAAKRWENTTWLPSQTQPQKKNKIEALV